MSEAPSYDELERGHVVLAPDPFRSDDDVTRPWVVVNGPEHPFDGAQYVVLSLTSRSWYDERVPLTEEDYVHRRAPAESSIVPHAPMSVQPRVVTDYICRVDEGPVDRAVDELYEYL